MKSCRDYQELISRLIDGDLTEDERADVEQHVESCPDCAAVYEAFRSLSDALGDLAEPPEALRENIMADVRRDRLRVIGRRRTIRVLAACLAVVILAAFTAPRLLRKGSSAAMTANVNATMAAGKAADAAAEGSVQTMMAAPVPAPEAPAVCEEAEDECAPAEANDGGMAASGSVSMDASEAVALYTLDEEQSRAFLSLLEETRADGFDTESAESLQVLVQDGGELREFTVYLCGDEIYYEAADGSSSGRLGCSEEELFALLG